MPVITPNTSIKRTKTTNTANIILYFEVTDFEEMPKGTHEGERVLLSLNLINLKIKRIIMKPNNGLVYLNHFADTNIYRKFAL